MIFTPKDGKGQLLCGGETITAGDTIPKKWAKQNPESIKSLEERGMIDDKEPIENQIVNKEKSEDLTKRELAVTEREEAVEARESAAESESSTIEDRELAVTEREEAVEARESAASEREALVEERESALNSDGGSE